MPQIADYSMIANAAPDPVALVSPEDMQQKKLTIANLAQANRLGQVQVDKADDSGLVRSAVQKSTTIDPANKQPVTDHSAVVGALVSGGRGDLAQQYQSQVQQEQTAKAKQFYDTHKQDMSIMAQLINGVKSAPPEKRDQAYQTAKQQFTQLTGHPSTGSPDQWDDAWGDQVLGSVRSIEDMFKQQGAEDIQKLKNQGAANIQGMKNQAGADKISEKPVGVDQWKWETYQKLRETDPAMAKEFGRANGFQPVSADASAQGAVAEAKASGKTISEAKASLPKVESAAKSVNGYVDSVLNHEGRPWSTGLLSLAPTIRGTRQSDFRNKMDQIGGQAFLQAFETLRGGGQITQIEGEKATAAINRMKASTSDEEFNAAAKDFKAVVESSLKNARDLASGKSLSMTPSAPGEQKTVNWEDLN